MQYKGIRFFEDTNFGVQCAKRLTKYVRALLCTRPWLHYIMVDNERRLLIEHVGAFQPVFERILPVNF